MRFGIAMISTLNYKLFHEPEKRNQYQWEIE